MREANLIPAQAGIQRAECKRKNWTPAYAGVTRIFAVLALIGFVAGIGALIVSDSQAASAAPIASALPHQPLAVPVKVWRDCQEIAMCTGCRPVYRCRSCGYRRTCEGGRCGWGDVCVWGPYVKVVPRGARIIRVR